MNKTHADVVILGAGLAGLACAINLAKKQKSVVCIEKKIDKKFILGESLDWACPKLFSELGIPLSGIEESGSATKKVGIKFYDHASNKHSLRPPKNLNKFLSNIEPFTFHVDRIKIYNDMLNIAEELGVTFIEDSIQSIEATEDRTIQSVSTRNSGQIKSDWFVDASGRSQILAKKFGENNDFYGPKKVCLWSVMDHTSNNRSTTFFFPRGNAAYLNWLWNIPVSSTKTSFGYIIDREYFRQELSTGKSGSDLFFNVLNASNFSEPKSANEEDVNVLHFQNYVVKNAADANWMMVGESASAPDPITSSGASSGLRHAEYAAEIISSDLGGQARAKAFKKYNDFVHFVGSEFNNNCENELYSPEYRKKYGVRHSANFYSIFGYLFNYAVTRAKRNHGYSMFSLKVSYGLLKAFRHTFHFGWLVAGRSRQQKRALATATVRAQL